MAAGGDCGDDVQRVESLGGDAAGKTVLGFRAGEAPVRFPPLPPTSIPPTGEGGMTALSLAADDELVGTTEAARRLGIGSKTLLRRIHRGHIRARRSGRAWVIPSSELARVRA